MAKKHSLELMFPLVWHAYPKDCQELDLQMRNKIAPQFRLLRQHWDAGQIEAHCRDLSIRSTACVASIRRGDVRLSSPEDLQRFIRVFTIRNRLYGRLRRNVLSSLSVGIDMPFQEMELEVLVDALEREADPDWTVLFEGTMKCPDEQQAQEMSNLTHEFFAQTGFRDPKNYFYKRYADRCSRVVPFLKKFTQLPVQDVYLSGSSARGTGRRADVFSGLHHSDLDVVMVLDPEWACSMQPAEVAAKVEQECERILVEYFFDPYFENLGASAVVSRGSYCVNLSRAPNAYYPLRLDIDIVPAIPSPEGGHFILNMKEGVWFKTNHKMHLEAWTTTVRKRPEVERVIFMLKVWNTCNGNLRQGRKPMFKGIHFEALLLDWARGPAPVFYNDAEALLAALLHIQEHFREPFVAGNQQHAATYITEDSELALCVERRLEEAAGHIKTMCAILSGRPIEQLCLDEIYNVSKEVAALCNQDVEVHEKPVLHLGLTDSNKDMTSLMRFFPLISGSSKPGSPKT